MYVVKESSLPESIVLPDWMVLNARVRKLMNSLCESLNTPIYNTVKLFMYRQFISPNNEKAFVFQWWIGKLSYWYSFSKKNQQKFYKHNLIISLESEFFRWSLIGYANSRLVPAGMTTNYDHYWGTEPQQLIRRAQFSRKMDASHELSQVPRRLLRWQQIQLNSDWKTIGKVQELLELRPTVDNRQVWVSKTPR